MLSKDISNVLGSTQNSSTDIQLISTIYDQHDMVSSTIAFKQFSQELHV